MTQWLRFLIPGVLAGVLASQVSCSTMSSGGRQKQASSGIVGNQQLAMAAFRATAVASIRQPITTTRLGIAILWNRSRELVTGNVPVISSPQPVLAEAPGTAEFEKMLDRKRFPRAESGSLDWLVDGSRFFPELDRQIASAQKSIDIQIFIFDNDDIAVRYADKLKRRSTEVSVKVLFDDFGSSASSSAAPETLGPPGFAPPADMHTYLREGSKVRARRILGPWLACDHTKLLVFDRRTAIIGGMNIGREYFSEWHDLMVRIEGPVVGSLSREFNRAWRKAGPGGDLALFRKPAMFRRPPPVADGVPLRILRTDPAEGRHDIFEASLLAIGGARKRVWIENPYFANDEIVLAVESAARRGVDVRVILPAAGDSAIMDAANMATAERLIRAGAKVFRYPRMTHLKVMICDNWATFGSANLDTLSMRINRELNLACSHAPSVMELEKAIFRPDFSRSKRVSLAEIGTATNPIVETIADQL